MILSFDRSRVQAVILKSQKDYPCIAGHQKCGNETISSGLRLVGENGLYVVPDHPELFSEEEFRVYAYEANPFTMSFSAWRDSIQRVFGSTLGGELVISGELTFQWIFRTLLNAVRIEVSPLGVRLIYDFDLDSKKQGAIHQKIDLYSYSETSDNNQFLGAQKIASNDY